MLGTVANQRPVPGLWRINGPGANCLSYSYYINYSILFLSRPSRCPKDNKMLSPALVVVWGSTAIITPTGVLQAGKSTGSSCPPQKRGFLGTTLPGGALHFE